MYQVWNNKEAGSDKIIALDDQAIHKGNPRPEALHGALTSVNNQRIPKGFFRIPYTYIREVHLQEGKDYVQVFFGKDSEEHIRIKDDLKRQAFFDALKDALPGAVYSREEYSAWKSAKKAIIATLVVSVLFAIVLDTAIRLERDDFYGVQFFIVLFFAGLGVRNVILLFGSLISIGLISTIIKIKNRPVIQLLEVKK
ncbi:hypothetical protein [Flavilitoribacter nigricans]|uniref:Uncharacterized protein n=1 Tax=Flavilitoribacter nigricans (strain ATCC 23147 / DSM 23189 / NBRC 102662 / NCIMB 1420 / SS-2) TaxID=1122177 RepID=A0A2D0N0F6_FLAN2|nr:hypothetical protein [Flavilitoribacter nigricans]PHN01193.1 hypothetical protein CRP01_38275 [Flavilitoribacter nigricans DSM 23189 = NBRC 102662]